jgi:hypothetical protein
MESAGSFDYRSEFLHGLADVAEDAVANGTIGSNSSVHCKAEYVCKKNNAPLDSGSAKIYAALVAELFVRQKTNGSKKPRIGIPPQAGHFTLNPTSNSTEGQLSLL